jgi:hypothetical protein
MIMVDEIVYTAIGKYSVLCFKMVCTAFKIDTLLLTVYNPVYILDTMLAAQANDS